MQKIGTGAAAATLAIVGGIYLIISNPINAPFWSILAFIIGLAGLWLIFDGWREMSS